MTLAQMVEDLPTGCDVGTKRNAKGHQVSWTGYKLHLDAADGGIPLSCMLTSASLHDSQVAIPLATMTAQRVTNLYDLMDSAYDAPEIRANSESLGQVPIIDLNPRRNAALNCGRRPRHDAAPAMKPLRICATGSAPPSSASTVGSRTNSAPATYACAGTARCSAT